jgi:hypothetical protein
MYLFHHRVLCHFSQHPAIPSTYHQHLWGGREGKIMKREGERRDGREKERGKRERD